MSMPVLNVLSKYLGGLLRLPLRIGVNSSRQGQLCWSVSRQ